MKKAYIILLAVLTFASCQKEENLKIRSNPIGSFQAEDFKKIIPVDFTVDWNRGREVFSENFKTDITEYPIIYTSELNPLNSKKNKSNFYTIIAIKENNSFNFYLKKYLAINKNQLISFSAVDEEYTGFTKTLNKEGNQIFSNLYYKGKIIAVSDKNFTKKAKTLPLTKKMALDRSYYIVRTHTYIDRYRGDGGGGYTYIRTDYMGYTEEVVWNDRESELYEAYSNSDLVSGGGSSSGPYGEGYAGDVNLEEATIEKIEDRNAAYELYKIDSDSLTGKEKCLNDLLDGEGNSYVQDLLENFRGESDLDITIESKDNLYVDGDSKNGLTFPPSNNTIKIQISTNAAASRPALSVVRTILHEYIHADMFRKLEENSTTGVAEDLKFDETYSKFKNGNFEASPQHETMADLYINEMTKALKDFHKNALVGDYNYLTDNLKVLMKH